ncbi:MAG: HEAT repeat domain-containing protein [Planctomycetota bacterium]|jgi:hypothetical protein
MKTIHVLTFFLSVTLFVPSAAGVENRPFTDPPAPDSRPAARSGTKRDLQDPPQETEEERFRRLDRAIKVGSGEEREAAVRELEPLETPRAVDTLVLAIQGLPNMNPLPTRLRLRCMTKLCALGEAGIGKDVPRKVRASIMEEMDSQKANSDPSICRTGLAFLLPRMEAKALDLTERFLSFPVDGELFLEMVLQHGSVRAIELLKKLAMKSPRDRPRLKRSAIEHLGRWGRGAPLYSIRVPVLLKALKTSFHREALSSLQSIAFPDFQARGLWQRWWTERKKESWDLEILRADFDDEFARAPDEAAVTIARWVSDWDSPHFVWASPLLHDLLRDRRYEDVRTSLLETIGRIGDPGSLDALEAYRRTLNGSDPTTRGRLIAAIDALGRTGAGATSKRRDEAGSLLMAELENIHPSVKAAAATALGRLRHARAEKRLLELAASDKRELHARKAVEALGEMGATGALEDILILLDECSPSEVYKDSEMARSALIALEKLAIRNQVIEKHVIVAIQSPVESVCLDAIRLVGGDWMSTLAIDPIWGEFRDEKNTPPLREAALEALAAYPPALTSQNLIEVLGMNFDRKVRYGKEFHGVALRSLKRPGALLAEHGDDLAEVVADSKANEAGRIECIRFLCRKEIWTLELGVSTLAPLLGEGASQDLMEAARDALIEHPSRTAMGRMIDKLPETPAHRWELHHEWQLVIVQRYRYHLQGVMRAPDFDKHGKKWRAWFKANRYRLGVLDTLGD